MRSTADMFFGLVSLGSRPNELNLAQFISGDDEYTIEGQVLNDLPDGVGKHLTPYKLFPRCHRHCETRDALCRSLPPPATNQAWRTIRPSEHAKAATAASVSISKLVPHTRGATMDLRITLAGDSVDSAIGWLAPGRRFLSQCLLLYSVVQHVLQPMCMWWARISFVFMPCIGLAF